MIHRSWLFVGCLLFPVLPLAADEPASGPQAGSRTHEQNYRDMALALCIAHAYPASRAVAADVGSSYNALRDYALFDLDKSPSAMGSLVDAYLGRDYTNPLAEAEVPGLRFDFLKCLDLYHGTELDRLVEELVIEPMNSSRIEDPTMPADENP